MEASVVLTLLYRQSWLGTPGLMEGRVGDAEGAALGGKSRENAVEEREKILEREWRTCHLPYSLLRRPGKYMRGASRGFPGTIQLS